MPPSVTRAQVLAFRATAQQLDRAPGATPLAQARLLDIGAQDTGPDGATWALAIRGVEVAGTGPWPDELALAWTVRGAPHAYRRAELAQVARALVPFSEADAAARVYDAARPLRAAGIPMAEAWASVGRELTRVVTEPMAKGDVSTALTRALPEPFRRWCRVCGATHLYEQTFRLPALHAGVVTLPGTSPPVMAHAQEVPGDHLASLAEQVSVPPSRRPVPAHLDLVRAYLALLGPAGPTDVARYLDAPVADLRRRWAELTDSGELAEVDVEGERRWLLERDLEALLGATSAVGDGVVRLLGPYDLFLQARDRPLVVPDADRRRSLWPTLGRPGAVLAGIEVVGTWRPRASGARLGVQTDPWTTWDARLGDAVDEQVDRLAAFRGLARR